MSEHTPRRSLSYYGKRLLTQAVKDPRVEIANRDDVRAYAEGEAAKLCLPPNKTASAVMQAYDTLPAAKFELATQFT